MYNPGTIVSSTPIPPHPTALYPPHISPSSHLFSFLLIPFHYIIIILPRLILGQSSNTALDTIFDVPPYFAIRCSGFARASISGIKLYDGGP